MSKINVDGAVARNGDHGAISSMCRVGNGVFLGGFGKDNAGIVDPVTLEAMAAEAISWLDLGLSRFNVSSDCLEVIDMLTKNICCYSSILFERVKT
jgi:hypothetical protein